MEDSLKMNAFDSGTLERDALSDYNDGTFVLIDSVKNLPDGASDAQQGMLLFMLCTQGHLRGEICGRTYDVCVGDSVICSPHLRVESLMVSPDFDANIFGMTSHALRFNMPCQGKELFKIIMYSHEHPIHHLNDEERHLVTLYYDLIHRKIAEADGPFHREVMHSLFCTVLYEICGMVARRTETQPAREGRVKHSDYLFRRFLELLEQHGHRERSVSAYARWLNVSAKHLSNVIKEVSGYPALQWIHRNTAEIIAHQLRNTDMSIKEIAYDLNFTNLSFFGKFCKAQLGCAPKKFRESGGSIGPIRKPMRAGA